MIGKYDSLVKELRYSTLKSILANGVVQFKAKYTAHLHDVAELEQNCSENKQLQPSELQHCIDPELLAALVTLEVFDSSIESIPPGTGKVDEVPELSDAPVRVRLDERAVVSESDVAESV